MFWIWRAKINPFWILWMFWMWRAKIDPFWMFWMFWIWSAKIDHYVNVLDVLDFTRQHRSFLDVLDVLDVTRQHRPFFDVLDSIEIRRPNSHFLAGFRCRDPRVQIRHQRRSNHRDAMAHAFQDGMGTTTLPKLIRVVAQSKTNRMANPQVWSKARPLVRAQQRD